MIVDDDPSVRRAVRALLDEQDIPVVGEAGDGREGVERSWLLAPDVVLMDLRMPVLGGVDATRMLLKFLPGTRVIIWTAFDEPELWERASNAGAVAMVVKGRPRELLATIQRACLVPS